MNAAQAKRAIKALGGGTKVARAISAETGVEVDREAVYAWQNNGVPRRWRPIVSRLLKARAERQQDAA